MDTNVGEIKEIIVITDGKSNIGRSPIEAARAAKDRGIIVSAIGILDDAEGSDESDVEEVEGIAQAGGGLCDYTHIDHLSKTMQLMTQKTAQKTIEQIVSRQLKSIIGTDINNIEPKSRFKIVDFIEKCGDKVNLKCVIALDTSKSMTNKLNKAKISMLDLLNSLKAREGQSHIAVVAFPGIDGQSCSIVCSFTDDINILEDRVRDIKANGGTPTGPAIDIAVELILSGCEEKILPQREIERYYV